MWIMTILRNRAGHKRTVLFKGSGALEGHAVILVILYTADLHVLFFHNPQPHNPRITQWRISSCWGWMAWSSWSSGFCYLKFNTAREGPKMHSEDV
jgi:hypothetical protein